MKKKKIIGRLLAHSETGTEGLIWTLEENGKKDYDGHHPLKKGDQVVVHTVGAYNMTQWMQFIALRPAVVMIGMDGKPNIIRRRETLQSIDKNEEVPSYLKKFSL